jgi:hypothetical protein
MGKRELLLIVCFAVVGVVVYQVTAPPLQPGQDGFSFGRVIQNIRRGMQGNRASATVETTRSEAIDSEVQELRIVLRNITLTVEGSTTDTVDFKLSVRSNGFDEAEATRLATASVLKVDRAGPAMVVAMSFPQQGTQRATLAIHVPPRFRVRIEPGSGEFTLTGVANVEAAGLRGAATLKNISGAITLTHSSGPLVIDGAGSLRLNTRGSEAKVQHIGGTCTATTQGGELTISSPSGTVEVESRNTDVTLEDLKGLKAPLRVNATNGSLRVKGLRAEARIDGNNSELDVTMDAAAPLTIYNTHDDIHFTPAPGGFALDAVAVNGRLSLPENTIKPSGDDREQRAAGAMNGGGVPVTLRVTDGSITVRTREGK